MPGRLSIYNDTSFKHDITQILGTFKDDIQHLTPNYNTAPTINIPIFTNTKHYTYAHFGLIPSWASDRSAMQINARSESVFGKVTFKEAYKSRRCLLMVNGYYEWLKITKGMSQPYYISPKDSDYFAFAGIYEEWYDNELGRTILGTALLTTEPNDFISPIHDRMPVILAKESWQTWLDPQSDYYHTLNTLYTPYPSSEMQMHTVSEVVNSVKNNSPECIVEGTVTITGQGSLF